MHSLPRSVGSQPTYKQFRAAINLDVSQIRPFNRPALADQYDRKQQTALHCGTV